MADSTFASTRRRSRSLVAVVAPVLTALVAVAYAVGAYFLFLVPKISPLMKGGEYDFSYIRAQLTDDENYAQKLKDTIDAFAKISDEQQLRVSSIMPYDGDIPGLFVQLDEVAKANKMLLMSVDSSVDEKSVTPQGRKTIRVSVNVSGGDYEQFKLYLADMEKSVRLFDIQNLSFQPDSSNYGFILKTYFIDRKAQPAAVTAKK